MLVASSGRTWADLDHARAQGYEDFYDGLTPADIPYDEFSGHLRDWWLAGWRTARAGDESCVTNQRIQALTKQCNADAGLSDVDGRANGVSSGARAIPTKPVAASVRVL